MQRDSRYVLGGWRNGFTEENMGVPTKNVYWQQKDDSNGWKDVGCVGGVLVHLKDKWRESRECRTRA